MLPPESNSKAGTGMPTAQPVPKSTPAVKADPEDDHDDVSDVRVPVSAGKPDWEAQLDPVDASQRQFLRNIYMLLSVQWTLLAGTVWLVTYWPLLHQFISIWFRGIEMVILMPSLVVTLVLMMAFKTDKSKNLYVCSLFVRSRSVGVGCFVLS